MRNILSYSLLMIGLLLTLAGPALGGHLSLQPTGLVALAGGPNQPVHACALKFDFSAIPQNARIDLAELTITADIDTLLGREIPIFAGAATQTWTSRTLPRQQSIATSDTLFADAFSLTGSSRRIEINLTELVTLWCSGNLANNGLVLSTPGNAARQLKLAGLPNNVQVTLSVYYNE